MGQNCCRWGVALYALLSLVTQAVGIDVERHLREASTLYLVDVLYGLDTYLPFPVVTARLLLTNAAMLACLGVVHDLRC